MKFRFIYLVPLIIAISCTERDNSTPFEPDNSPPVVSITLPQPSDSLRGLVDITAEATDNAGIVQVEFYIDGALPDSQAIDEEAPYLYSWDTETVPDGTHLIYVRAYDLADNYGDAVPLLVEVDNINENAPRNIHVPGDYPTIQQGVNAAMDGDTVLVGPGVYHEVFNYKGKAIWVKSEDGPAETVWEAIQSNIFILFNTGEITSSVLCGFSIKGAYIGIIFQDNCSPTITNCILSNIGYTGIFSDQSTANIYNNTIYDCYTGMDIGGQNSVVNNIVASGSSHGLWNAQLDPQYAPIGDYNDVWDWGTANYNARWNIGEHDISADPMFQDTIAFQLQPGSPCIDVGDPELLDPDGTRSDIGAWGGPHAY